MLDPAERQSPTTVTSPESAPAERPARAPVAHAETPAVPVVEVQGLGKAFGPHRALEDVSLSVAAGEVVGIIGPSGSGKSTLLRCINHLEQPTSGRVLIDGVPIADPGGREPSAKELAALRRKVGMVFQSFNLFPHLTAVENVMLAQVKALGRPKQEARARALELLERVGIADKADSRPRRCSGGQQQRIAIARALALDPRVMLFDEPTSALDPELGLEVLGVMRELASDGMTMIVVTHEMHFAEEVADRIVFMADGRIVEEGPPRQVMRAPRHERTRRFLRAVLDR
ncbi:MAG: amino acid ABC transporter ATP-binding protein [Thermoleophilaceae bacterium]|nr:amino acid ABC transporter ATP-binding protein [Thermoleophilaceae bacterium]